MPGEGDPQSGGGQVAGGAVASVSTDQRHFRKGPFLAALDGKSREVDRAQAEEVLKDLRELRGRTGPSLGLDEVIRRWLPETHEGDRRHVEQHWLEAWRMPHEAERVLINGLIKALEVAIQGASDREEILPFDSYWISGSGRVEVVVTCNDRQVNILIFTPTAVGPAYRGSYEEQEEIWSVHKGGARNWESLEHEDRDGVITTRLCRRPPGGGAA